MTILSAATDLLARDVSLWGGLTSPLFSWLGSAGLLVFFGWQIVRLFLDASRASAPFLHVRALLTALANEVEASDLRHAYERAFADDQPAPDGKPSASGATDIDRVVRLDAAMRETGMLRRPWVQFRKTLLIERVAWFKEPRIFATRRAEEFFTAEAVLEPSIDLGAYGQVPSLIAGIGLLLTFVAICIGLSRLHADGSTITGIQGLINGLAGKFLTSIVALVCANLFVLLERAPVRRLHALHEEFLTLLDESFPRRTAEDLLDELRTLSVAVQALGKNQLRSRAEIATLADRVSALTGTSGDRDDARDAPWDADTVPLQDGRA